MAVSSNIQRSLALETNGKRINQGKRRTFELQGRILDTREKIIDTDAYVMLRLSEKSRHVREKFAWQAKTESCLTPQSDAS